MEETLSKECATLIILDVMEPENSPVTELWDGLG